MHIRYLLHCTQRCVYNINYISNIICWVYRKFAPVNHSANNDGTSSDLHQFASQPNLLCFCVVGNIFRQLYASKVGCRYETTAVKDTAVTSRKQLLEILN